jgi:hypothetical protein
MTTVKFEVMPDDAGNLPVFVDDVPFGPGQACYAEIVEGPHRGMWMFSSKRLAERFCFERGLEPEFVEADDA